MEIHFIGKETVIITEENILGKEKELRLNYDNKEIISYEIIFNENILVKEVHDLSNITLEMIKTLIIKYKDEK